jgi:hypothetical protein
MDADRGIPGTNRLNRHSLSVIAEVASGDQFQFLMDWQAEIRLNLLTYEMHVFLPVGADFELSLCLDG